MFVMDVLVRSCSSAVPDTVVEAARVEGMDAERMARRIAAGRIVIPANTERQHRLCAIGQGCTVKVNVNVGTSGTRCDFALEEKKARACLLYTSPSPRDYAASRMPSSA